MQRALSDATVTARAGEVVAATAERAAVVVRDLTTGAELAAAAEVLTEVWQSPFSDHILRAFELSGNYVGGTFDTDGRLVAASVAFAVVSDEPELHSHITGVASSHRRSGVGSVMKLHQRWWALEHGIGVINWTFDPLIKRNAKFNLSRLGAVAGRYLVNVYGDMDDVLNGRDESDRLWVRWRLAEPQVEAAAAGRRRYVEAPADTVDRLAPGPDGRPLVRTFDDQDGRSFTCQVPEDIESLRLTDPELATAWRMAVRDVLGGALAAGGRLLGLDETGNYVVSAGPAEAQ